jgi:glyoxylase-like metal-dependent hydrolase (beta-lactamase superfamily II)
MRHGGRHVRSARVVWPGRCAKVAGVTAPPPAAAPEPLLPGPQPAGRGAWAEPGVYPVAEGVHRIPLPLPGDALRAVNVYAIEEADRIVLVDSGWHRDDSWGALTTGLRSLGAEVGDVSRVLVTHIHNDHFGQAPRLRRESGATILLGEGERRSFDIIADDGERQRSHEHGINMLRRHGAGDLAEEWAAVLTGANAVQMSRGLWEQPDTYAIESELIELESRTLRVVSTPGHTRGHVSLMDEANALLFTGDHVLPHITPSIGVEPFNDGLALVEFLMSLTKVRELPVERALPAHGPEFDDLSGRVDALLAHHAARLAACVDAVRGTERSAAEVAAMLPWTRRARRLDELDLFNRVLAVNETVAHLELLRTEGTLSRREVDGTIVYRVVQAA